MITGRIGIHSVLLPSLIFFFSIVIKKIIIFPDSRKAREKILDHRCLKENSTTFF